MAVFVHFEVPARSSCGVPRNNRLEGCEIQKSPENKPWKSSTQRRLKSREWMSTLERRFPHFTNEDGARGGSDSRQVQTLLVSTRGLKGLLCP